MDEIEQQGQALSDYREAIIEVLNQSAIDIGNLLIAAKYRHPRRFEAWVDEELPFGVQTARRLMAISRGLRDLPPEKRELLPSPASTLYTLTTMDPEILESHMESGEIHPKMTNKQALALARANPAPLPAPRDWKSGPPPGTRVKSRPRASLLIGQLMRYRPEEVDPTNMARLKEWLAGEPHESAPRMVESSELCRN